LLSIEIYAFCHKLSKNDYKEGRVENEG
jgi:hypothetical protein